MNFFKSNKTPDDRSQQNRNHEDGHSSIPEYGQPFDQAQAGYSSHTQLVQQQQPMPHQSSSHTGGHKDEWKKSFGALDNRVKNLEVQMVQVANIGSEMYQQQQIMKRHENELSMQVGKNEAILADIKDTKTDLIQVRENVNGIQSHVNQHNSELDKASRDRQDIKINAAAMAKALERANNKNEQLERGIETVSAEIRKTAQDTSILQMKIGQIDKIDGLIYDQGKQLRDLDASKSSDWHEIQSLRAQTDQLTRNLSGLSTAVDQNNMKIGGAVKTNDARIQTLGAQMMENDKKMREIEMKFKGQESELDGIKKEQESAERRIYDYRDSFEKFSGTFGADFHTKSIQLTNISAQLDDQSKSIHDLEVKRAGDAEDISNLKRENERFEELLYGTREDFFKKIAEKREEEALAEYGFQRKDSDKEEEKTEQEEEVDPIKQLLKHVQSTDRTAAKKKARPITHTASNNLAGSSGESSPSELQREIKSLKDDNLTLKRETEDLKKKMKNLTETVEKLCRKNQVVFRQ